MSWLHLVTLSNERKNTFNRSVFLIFQSQRDPAKDQSLFPMVSAQRETNRPMLNKTSSPPCKILLFEFFPSDGTEDEGRREPMDDDKSIPSISRCRNGISRPSPIFSLRLSGVVHGSPACHYHRQELWLQYAISPRNVSIIQPRGGNLIARERVKRRSTRDEFKLKQG